MSTYPYREGYQDYIVSLGIVKVAGPVVPAAPFMTQAGAWLKRKLPGWGHAAKDMMFGSPTQFAEEVRQGRAFAPNSLIRQSVRANTLLEKGLFYGLPAYQIASTLKSGGPDKAERVGGILGGSLMGLAAFKPLGMAGSMIFGGLGERLGEKVMGGAKHVIAKPPQQPYGGYYGSSGY